MLSHIGTDEAVLWVGLDMYRSAVSVILSQPRNTSTSSFLHLSAKPSMPLSVRFEQSVRQREARDVNMLSFAALRPSCTELNQKQSSLNKKTSSRSRWVRYQQLVQILHAPRSDTLLSPFRLRDSRAGHVSAMQITPWSVRSLHMLISRCIIPVCVCMSMCMYEYV
jgi:hypothetical protein